MVVIIIIDMLILFIMFYIIHSYEAGVTVLVGDPLDAAVCHLVDVAIAGHLPTVDVRSYHMLMG